MLRKTILITLVALGACPVPGAAAPRAQAPDGATFVVTTAGDSGPGSLRQAILDANASPGADEIRFDVGGASPVRIQLASTLPGLVGPVTLDGAIETVAGSRPGVELAGGGALSVGVGMSGSGGVVRGLVVNGFTFAGIVLAGNGHAVEGCYVGTDATGTRAVANGDAGIVVGEGAQGMRVGGTTAAAGNVISGNGGRYGFGGGVYVNQATDTVIQGNLIGTDVTGTRALGNGGAGVYFDHAYPALVGGAEPGAGNVIAYNASPGVAGDRGIRITVRRNSIFANGDDVENYNGFYGIHFDQYNVQQLPELTFAGAEGDGTRVKGGLYTPRYAGSFFPTSVVIEFFRSSECFGDEFGQGQTFVGDLEATFDETGLVTFSVLLPVRLEPGEVLTATATGADGSTSYFSRCLGDTHGCDLPFVRFVTRDLSVPVGDPVTVAVEISGSAPIAYQWYRIEEGTSTPIPGATASSYTPPDGYTSLKVVATNACGNAVAYPLVWRCSVPPAFLEQPQSATIPAGTSVQLTMSLAVGEFARVQWYQGRSGDTSTPVRSRSNEFLPPPLTETTSYWVRATNGCGTVDSETATLRVVAAMEITSVEIKGAGAKAKIVAKGRNIGGNVVVYVEGNGFTRAAKVSGSKITQRGPAAGGATIDDLIPPGATVRIDFISDERGYVQVEYTRPQ